MKNLIHSSGLRKFLFIFHRKANSLLEFSTTLRKWNHFKSIIINSHQDLTPQIAVEGDVNWINDHGNFIPFLWHPRFLCSHVTTGKQLWQKEKGGEILLLENLLSDVSRSPYFVIELKDGNGIRSLGIEKVIDIITKTNLINRTIIDTYSITDTAIIKNIYEDIAVSLHTPLVIGRKFLHAPMNHNPFRNIINLSFRTLSEIQSADIITTFPIVSIPMTRKTMTRITETNKKGILGGLFTPKTMEKAISCGAMGGYIRFDINKFLKND